MNYSKTAQPTGAVSGGLPIGTNENAAAGLTIPHPGRSVNPGAGLLAGQAPAAEERALASAAWHRERAAHYLAWCDLAWCAARYAEHVDAATFQERLAARHAAVRAALEGGRP